VHLKKFQFRFLGTDNMFNDVKKLLGLDYKEDAKLDDTNKKERYITFNLDDDMKAHMLSLLERMFPETKFKVIQMK